MSYASHSVSPLGKWGEGIAAVTVIAFVVGGGFSLTSPPLPVPPSTWRASPLTAVCKVRNHPVYETAKETLTYRTGLWTLWERERVVIFGRKKSKKKKKKEKKSWLFYVASM